MFHSIRSRLVGTYLLIITLTVVFLEIIIISSVNLYYMDSINNLMKNQSEIAANFYSSYLSNTDIESNAGKILANFSGLPVQIQIVDSSGKVIADSLRATFGMKLQYPDIKEALAGKQGRFTGRDQGTGENVLSYAVPLKSRDGIAGAARFTTSLELTNRTIQTFIFYMVLVGAIIVLLIFAISLYISHTIIKPIKQVTRISDEMAKGNLSVRAEITHRDEIGVLSASLNHMANEIQKSESLKNEFISSISHELRTPLTSIKGWSSTLADTKPEESDIINRGIYIINKESDRLSDMVEELLDFSRLQSGSFSLHAELADINGLIRDVFEQMKPRAQRQGIQMEMDIPERPQYIEMDIKRMRQVLINLVDNSLKYTPEGGMVTFTAALSLMNGEETYTVILRDTGCGIHEGDLELIKNRFFRGRNAASDSGIGLGLSICDELVKSHGGSLEIESEVGKYTSVTIRLPLKS